MKKFAVMIFMILTLGIFCVNAQHVLEEKELNSISEFMNYRMELTKLQPEQALEKINRDFSRELQMSEQGKLILSSLIEIEKYVYGIKINPNNQQLKNRIVELSSRLEIKANAMEPSTVDPWLYCVTAAMDATSMQCLSVAKSLKRGLNVKKWYLAAIKKNPDMTYSLMNMGQWYFHAPAISGGSKEKALDLCRKSLEKAKNLGERFYASCVLSQIYFALGNRQKSAEFLQNAEQLAPGSFNVLLLKTLNGAGVSQFEYDADREKYQYLLKK